MEIQLAPTQNQSPQVPEAPASAGSALWERQFMEGRRRGIALCDSMLFAFLRSKVVVFSLCSLHAQEWRVLFFKYRFLSIKLKCYRKLGI